MARAKKRDQTIPAKQAGRTKLTAEESLKRLQQFAERKEQFVAAIRKGKDRSVPA